MDIVIRPYAPEDLAQMVDIWNRVVLDGVAFPQEECLDLASGGAFFAAQTHTAVAQDRDTGAILGLYILHPNNIGRCGHIGNASYAVRADQRGGGIGEKLVLDSLDQARRLGFGVMQFNAVVASNHAAHHLYRRLGFQPLGVIPRGFRCADGHMEDICLYYHTLEAEIQDGKTNKRSEI